MSRALPKTRAARHARGINSNGVELTQERVEQFLNYMQEQGRQSETISTYRGHLERLQKYLPEENLINPGTMDYVGQTMLEEGYSPNTVNICFSAVNSFLEYYGRRDLQVAKMQKVHEAQPEITRSEYCRLLMAAKQLDREREYLLVKVFATTGINVVDLSKITVQAVEEGFVLVSGRGGVKTRLVIPTGLRKELQDYISRKGILDGPVFLSRYGKPMERSNVNARIMALAKDAKVSEEKCTPRCLQKLYKDTLDSILGNVEAIVQHMHSQLLEEEQLEFGWQEQSIGEKV